VLRANKLCGLTSVLTVPVLQGVPLKKHARLLLYKEYVNDLLF